MGIGQMLIMAVVVIALFYGIVSYYHFYFRRILSLHFHRELNKKQNLWLWLASAVIVLPMVRFSSVYALVILHFLVFSSLFSLLYVIVRRKVWARWICTSGIVPLLVTAIVLGIGAYNMAHVVQTDYSMQSDKVDGLRIVQLSDIHTTGVSSPEHVAEYLEQINALQPDLVLLTGDIFEESTTYEDLKEVSRLLGTLKSRLGTYYCYGNHDNATYVSSPDFTPLQLREALEKNGIVILQDEVLTMENVTLVGRNDISLDRHRKSTSDLLQGTNMDNFIIVMDHQPLELDENAKAGADLQLSGHTHGGQIFPLGILSTIVMNRLTNGSKQIGDFMAVTSSGFAGWGYPVKTEGAAEYVVIDVQ